MKKQLLLILILGLIVCFAGFTSKKGYKIGDEVEDFALQSVNGKTVSMADYKNVKGFIIIFDCNTCPFSELYLDRIKWLHKNYAGKGYPVIAINPNDPNRSPGDSFDEMVSHAKANKYQHAYLYDSDQSVARRFGATNTPHTYVLQKTASKILVSYIGAIDNNPKNAKSADKKYVESAVDALLQGENPKQTKTKAIGCTIKWKK